MGTAVPLIGLGVSTVSTISGISSQNRAAEEQRNALDLQNANNQANADLREIELQRQRLYAEFQNSIDELYRNQAQAFQENQLAQQREQIDFEQTQLQQGADLSNQQINRGQAANNYSINEQLNNQVTQNNLNRIQGVSTNNFNAGNQIYQNNFNRQTQLQQNSLNQQTTNQDIVNQQQQRDIGNTNQLIQGLGNNAAQVQQVLDVLQQTAQQATQNDADLFFQGSYDGLGTSDIAKLNQDSLIDQQLLSDPGIQRQLELLGIDKDVLLANYKNQINDSRLESFRSRQLNNYGTQAQNQALNANTDVQNRILSSLRDFDNSLLQSRTNLSNDALVRQAEISKLDNNQNADLQRSQVAYELLNNLLQNGLDEQALGLLELAQQNNFDLERTSASINNEFADLALSSQLIGNNIARNSQTAITEAQKSSIQSPGLLGYANTLGQAAVGARGILSTQPSNPSPYSFNTTVTKTPDPKTTTLYKNPDTKYTTIYKTPDTKYTTIYKTPDPK